MKYRSNLKMQVKYAALSFLLALAIIFMVTKELNLIVAVICGLGGLITSGFYRYKKSK